MASSYDHQDLFDRDLRTGERYGAGARFSCHVSRAVRPSGEPYPYTAHVAIGTQSAGVMSSVSMMLTREQLREAADVLTAAVDAWDADEHDPNDADDDDDTGCQCGQAWEGPEPCHAELGADAVIIESMPVGLRASHEAAGGFGGVYPFDGSRRYDVTPGCAAHLIAHDPDWSEIVG